MVTIKQLLAIKHGEWLSDGWPRGGGQLLFRRSDSAELLAYFRYSRSNGNRDTMPIAQFDKDGRNGLTLPEIREKAGGLSRLYQSGIKDVRTHLAAKEANRIAALSAEKAAQIAAHRESQIRQRYTLRALCNAYTDHLIASDKAQSAGSARSVFKVHVFEADTEIADTPARELTADQAADLIRRVREVGKERTGGVLRSYLRAAFGVAIRARFDSSLPASLKQFEIEHNPIDAIPAIPVHAGHRTLSAHELRAYMEALGDSISDQALLLALLSGGQRMAQVLRLKINDYDASVKVLRLWDRKGRRKSAREHLLPLGPLAALVVERLVERANLRAKKYAGEHVPDPNPFLFMSVGVKLMAEATCSKRVAAIVQSLKTETFNLRDVRRTVETMMASMGVSRDTRAQLLSHGLGGVQNVHYDKHDYFDEKRRALRDWEKRLVDISMEDGSNKPRDSIGQTTQVPSAYPSSSSRFTLSREV